MIKVILTGATGMVGEGVLLECLENPAVGEVLMVSRRSSPRHHPKLKECLVPDFFDLDSVTSQITGYDACFFCAGISSVGKSESEYTRLTYDLTLHFAETLVKLNHAMVFIYVSGALTDSSQKGRTMWARVKGRTENALQRVGFRAAYNFRPGFMRATPGQQNLLSYYKWIAWLYPLVRLVLPDRVSTLRDVGVAMIRCATEGYPRPILEIGDINTLAQR
jgi:uncharacterized protein YbjT (DUF2867 family)